MRLVVAAGSTDPTGQIVALVTLATTVLAMVGGATQVMRVSRRKERGEDSLVEQQRVELLDPIRAEVKRARDDRDRALRQRQVAIDALVANNVRVPPEVYQ